jgi:phosphatidylglycerophosphate synthase
MNTPRYEPTDRRPLQSRNTRWASKATDLLVSWKCAPNSISIFGMVAAIIAGVCFFATGHTENQFGVRLLWIAGACLCQVRLLCNLFDGMVAVARGIASKSGELFNEIPDRISDAAVMTGLGYATSGNIVLGFVAAIVAIFVAYVRAIGKSLGAPNDYCGPMAKQHRMAVTTILAVYMACRPPSISVGVFRDWLASSDRSTLDVGTEASLALLVIILGGIITAWRRIRRASNFLKGTS